LERILIVRNDRLGDLVLALPLVRALRKALPQAYLGFLASPYAAPLVEKDKDIDRVILADQPDSLEKIRREKFDTVLVLWANWKNAWLSFRAGIRTRIGPSARPFSFLFQKRLALRRSDGTRSEASYNLEYLNALGLPQPPLEGARLAFSREDEREAEAFLKRKKLGNRRPIILHPGHGGSAYNWSPAQYAAFGRLAQRAFKAKLLVTGGDAERELTQEVAEAIGGSGVGRLDQALPLRSFAALLGRARLFVSGSTGPMHLAAAAGAPTLSVFPPLRSMSPLRWGPLGNRHAVLTPPGLGFDCPPEAARESMKRISPEMALAHAKVLLD
jgi:ADP-heptose:LPS heptosyltransferase